MLDLTLALTVGVPLAILIYIVRSDRFPEPSGMVLKTFFIGHPLVETVHNNHNKFTKNDIIKRKYISIFPGSRSKEITTHLNSIEISSSLEY